LENRLASGVSVGGLTTLKPYIKLDSAGNIPACPAKGTYSVTTTSNAPTCSLSSDPIAPHALP
jgi:hypothetical protein